MFLFGDARTKPCTSDQEMWPESHQFILPKLVEVHDDHPDAWEAED